MGKWRLLIFLFLLGRLTDLLLTIPTAFSFFFILEQRMYMRKCVYLFIWGFFERGGEKERGERKRVRKERRGTELMHYTIPHIYTSPSTSIYIYIYPSPSPYNTWTRK